MSGYVKVVGVYGLILLTLFDSVSCFIECALMSICLFRSNIFGFLMSDIADMLSFYKSVGDMLMPVLG